MPVNIEELKQRLKKMGLQQRDSQFLMIQTAFNAFAEKKIQIIEAPTGTGKTLSYALAAMLAKQDKQQIVISTATVALQEQLYYKDLPLLSKLLQTPLRYSLAKGRRRYVCLARLDNANGQIELFAQAQSPSPSMLQNRLANNSWDGDRDTLKEVIDDKEWAAYSTDTIGCSGKLCQFYEQCAYYRARKTLFNSDFVITNHSLLLSDLVLGGGMLLPKPDKSLYVIDECHHLPEKALDHFARNTGILSSFDWLNQLIKLAAKLTQAQHINAQYHPKMTQSSEFLMRNLQQFHDWLHSNQAQFIDYQWRYDISKDQTALDLAKPLASYSLQLANDGRDLLTELEHKLEQTANPEEKTLYSGLISQFGFLLQRLDNLQQTWRLFCEPQQAGEAPLARWFTYNKPQRTKTENKAPNYFCHVAPINVSKSLQTLLWDNVTQGAVLCSATVRALGEFSDYRRKTGLTAEPRVQESLIKPFFNYANSVLFIPKMQHEPSGLDAAPHLNESIQLLPQLILPKSGTLVLFTSKNAMDATFSALSPALQADILLQGSLNKARLLEAHAYKIKNGQRSVLFGLATFGEGMDLPGKLCQHVIIHKLPFAVPTDPIELTRSEWLEKNNKNPFMLATLPQTSIRLTQYVGRLIRQEEDIGIVTILDKRLIHKFYGKKLLANLPAFTVLTNVDCGTLKNTASIQHLFTSAAAVITA